MGAAPVAAEVPLDLIPAGIGKSLDAARRGATDYLMGMNPPSGESAAEFAQLAKAESAFSNEEQKQADESFQALVRAEISKIHSLVAQKRQSFLALPMGGLTR